MASRSFWLAVTWFVLCVVFYLGYFFSNKTIDITLISSYILPQVKATYNLLHIDDFDFVRGTSCVSV